MSVIDIVLLIPVVWFAYKGFSKGLILSLTSLLALFAGIWISIHFSDMVADWLRNDMGFDNSYMSIISFVLTFVIVVVVIQILGNLLDKLVKMAELGIINRLFGMMFGLLRVALFLGILVFVINSIDTKGKLITGEMRNKSYLYNPLSKVIPGIWPLVKDWMPEVKPEKKDEKKEEKKDDPPAIIV